MSFGSRQKLVFKELVLRLPTFPILHLHDQSYIQGWLFFDMGWVHFHIRKIMVLLQFFKFPVMTKIDRDFLFSCGIIC